jgi:hypothetical protein
LPERVTPVDQMILKCGDHAADVEGFTQQQSTAVAGALISTRMDPLQAGVQVDRLSPMASSPLGSCSGRNILILQEKLLAIFFSTSAR